MFKTETDIDESYLGLDELRHFSDNCWCCRSWCPGSTDPMEGQGMLNPEADINETYTGLDELPHFNTSCWCSRSWCPGSEG